MMEHYVQVLKDEPIKDGETCVTVKKECADDIEQQFHCPFCQDGFSFEQELTNHVQHLHNDIYIDKKEVKQENIVGEAFGVVMDPLNLAQDTSQNECIKEEPELTFLRTKVIGVHPNNYLNTSKTKRNLCSSKKIDFNKLQKGATKSSSFNPQTLYSCGNCHKTFSRSRNLNDHMRVHTGEKPYSCKICQDSFSESGNMKRHMLTHTGKKPHSCDICKNSFSRSENLKTHMSTHTGEKPYSCDVCRKTFSQSGPLKKHMVTHTGDKPYSCDVCKKTFSQSGTVKKHMLIHTGEKPYSCDVCKKTFSQSGNLKAHMKFHTK